MDSIQGISQAISPVDIKPATVTTRKDARNLPVISDNFVPTPGDNRTELTLTHADLAKCAASELEAKDVSNPHQQVLEIGENQVNRQDSERIADTNEFLYSQGLPSSFNVVTCASEMKGGVVRNFVEDNRTDVSSSPFQNVYVSNTASDPVEISNEELQKQLMSGDPDVTGNAIAFVLTTGRNDDNIFNHVFNRLDNADQKLLDSLEALSIKEKIKLSGDKNFREEYISRLDKLVAKDETAKKLRNMPHLAYFMAYPLVDQLKDPRVARILVKLMY